MGMERGIEPVRAMRGVESCQIPPSAFLSVTQRLKPEYKGLETFLFAWGIPFVATNIDIVY